MSIKKLCVILTLLALACATPACDVFPPGDTAPGGSNAEPNDPGPKKILPTFPFSIGSGGTLKPVTFRNLGSVPYTVSAWTYVPLNPADPPIPSNASTVAVPGGNTSSSLSLPLGTYTWCYWWEMGDINDDGMIEYAHALDERPVTLDQTDSDDLSLAETVDLAAPADIDTVPGYCGLDISAFVIDKHHADNINGSLINMGHDGDSVTLRGPITVIYWYLYNTKQQIFADTPREYSKPEKVVIPAGKTWTFTLVDGHDEHPGDWNVYIWLVSIDG